MNDGSIHSGSPMEANFKPQKKLAVDLNVVLILLDSTCVYDWSIESSFEQPASYVAYPEATSQEFGYFC